MKQIMLIPISLLFIGCATVVPNNICPPKDYKMYKKNAKKPRAHEFIKDAIISSNTQNLKCMLEAGVDSNLILEGTDEYTPLVYSSYYGNKETSQILLDKQANIAYKTSQGITPLLAAVDNNNNEIISLLLSTGVDVEQKDNEGNTALIYAAKNGNLTAVTLLTGKRANVNTQNYKGESPLSIASDAKHYDVVKYLLPKVTDTQNIFKLTSSAIKDKDIKLLSAILEKKPQLLNEYDGEGKTLLILAVLDNNIDAVKFLLSKGADKNKPDTTFGITPLMYAARDNHENIFFELLNSGANTKQKSNAGFSAISFATKNPKILKVLIQKGGNVNESGNDNSSTPLMSYVIDSTRDAGNEEIPEILIKNKADINFQNKEGQTILMTATLFHQVEFVKKLLTYKPNINLKDKDGHSVIYYAIRGKSLFGGDLPETILAYSKAHNKPSKNFDIEMEYLQILTDWKREELDNLIMEQGKRKGWPEVTVELEKKKARSKMVTNYANQIASDYSYKHAVEYVHVQKDFLSYTDYIRMAKKYELNNLAEQTIINPKQFKNKDGSINEKLIYKLAPNATPLERLRATSRLKRK